MAGFWEVLTQHDPGALEIVGGEGAVLSRLSWKFFAAFVLGFGGFLLATLYPLVGWPAFALGVALYLWVIFRDCTYRKLVWEHNGRAKAAKASRKG